MRFTQLFGILIGVAGIASGLPNLNARAALDDADGLERRNEKSRDVSPPAARQEQNEHHRLQQRAGVGRARSPYLYGPGSNSSSLDYYMNKRAYARNSVKKGDVPIARGIQYAVGVTGVRNGDSALFIFGGNSRVVAYLRAGFEEADARQAAQRAIARKVVEQGEWIRVVVKAPTVQARDRAIHVVQANLVHRDADNNHEVVPADIANLHEQPAPYPPPGEGKGYTFAAEARSSDVEETLVTV